MSLVTEKLAQTEPDVLYFTNDDEFVDFCMCHKPIVMYSEISNMPYYDIPYTEEYLKEVERGTEFVINDPKSKIINRGCVNRGLITKPVKNLRHCTA